jgi:hypothetical protein
MDKNVLSFRGRGKCIKSSDCMTTSKENFAAVCTKEIVVGA